MLDVNKFLQNNVVVNIIWKRKGYFPTYLYAHQGKWQNTSKKEKTIHDVCVCVILRYQGCIGLYIRSMELHFAFNKCHAIKQYNCVKPSILGTTNDLEFYYPQLYSNIGFILFEGYLQTKSFCGTFEVGLTTTVCRSVRLFIYQSGLCVQ